MMDLALSTHQPRRLVVGEPSPRDVIDWGVGESLTMVIDADTEIPAVVLWKTPSFDCELGGHVLIVAFTRKPGPGQNIGLPEWTAVVGISEEHAHALRVNRPGLKWPPDAIKRAMEPLDG